MNETTTAENLTSDGRFGNTPYNEDLSIDDISQPFQNTTTIATICINPCGMNTTVVEPDYSVVVYILLLICLVAMLVNVVVILSVFWIRSPMTPNLKISLSLAAADACSSSISGLFMLIDNVDVFLGVLPHVIEVVRLSGIVITVVHLLALSLNHYIGILKPLHYNSIVTNRKVSVVIAVLWIGPTLTVISLCAAFDTEGTLLDNLLHNTDKHAQFMDTFAFRMSIAALFFVPIFLMVFCYTHILVVVRKQQNRWNVLSRTGSSRYKGRTTNNIKGGSHKFNKEKKQLEGNVRAVYTTLLILGSCFIGWTPALMVYILTCSVGCFVEGEALTQLNCDYPNVIMVVRLFENMLMIMKMLANPIIYSIRMKEIKDGTHRMSQAIKYFFCPCIREKRKNFPRSQKTQNSGGSVGTATVRMTSFKFINGNTAFGKDANNTFL